MAVEWATTGSWGADCWRAFTGDRLVGEVAWYRWPKRGEVFIAYTRRVKVSEHNGLADAQAAVASAVGGDSAMAG